MKDIDVQSLINDGYMEDERLCLRYERKFSTISLAGFIFIFSPAIGYFLNNDTLKGYYWFIGVPLGLFFLLLSIALLHMGSPIDPSTGTEMERYRFCQQVCNSHGDSVKTYDVWVCHESKRFCKRLFFESGDI